LDSHDLYLHFNLLTLGHAMFFEEAAPQRQTDDLTTAVSYLKLEDNSLFTRSS
jgi:hypothetical protein